jgi:hypothetical protein
VSKINVMPTGGCERCKTLANGGFRRGFQVGVFSVYYAQRSVKLSLTLNLTMSD